MKRKRRHRQFSGSLVARRRRGLGMTQRGLAAECGVDKTAVSHWETGDADPKISVLPALADSLKTTIDDLFEAA